VHSNYKAIIHGKRLVMKTINLEHSSGKTFDVPYNRIHDGAYFATSKTYVAYLNNHFGFGIDLDSYRPYRKIFLFKDHIMTVTYDVVTFKGEHGQERKYNAGYCIIDKDTKDSVINSFDVLNHSFYLLLVEAVKKKFDREVEYKLGWDAV
jgi:hypothetical protein